MTQNKKPTTTRRKKKNTKQKQEEQTSSKVQFSATSPAATKQSIQVGVDNDGIGNTSDLTNNFRSLINGSGKLPYQSDPMRKSVKPVTIRNDTKEKTEKTKIMFSAKSYHYSYDGVEVKGFQRLTDAELRDVAHVDPYISAIISTRCSQAAVVARPSDSKFDKGRVSKPFMYIFLPIIDII